MTLEANLLHRREELHLQALTDCYHSPSSQGSLELFPVLFIPSLPAFNFLLFPPPPFIVFPKQSSK